MREALNKYLPVQANKHVALAGVFRIHKGKIKSHVQPDYNDIKIKYYDPKQMKCVKDFLQFKFKRIWRTYTFPFIQA